jgi:hypothetical protein
VLPSAWPLWGNTFRVWWARRWGLASEVLASHLLRSHGFGDVNLEPHPSMYPAETVKLYLVTMWIWPNGVRFVLIWSRSSLTVGFFPCEKGSKIQQSCIIKRLVAPAQASPGWRFQNALQVLAEKCFVAFSLPTWNSLLLFFFSQHLSNLDGHYNGNNTSVPTTGTERHRRHGCTLAPQFSTVVHSSSVLLITCQDRWSHCKRKYYSCGNWTKLIRQRSSCIFSETTPQVAPSSQFKARASEKKEWVTHTHWLLVWISSEWIIVPCDRDCWS